MALKIVKTSDVKVDNVVLTIYGSPGSGKTSLAFTAKNPLILDFDNGSSRAYGLTGDEPIVKCKTWQDVMNITQEDLSTFDTLVIDTVGSMTFAMQLFAESKGKKGQQLYGEVGTIYKSFVNKVKSWGKDLVFIAHFTEKNKGDEIVVRIDAVGNIAKDNVYQSSDLLGYLYSDENGRFLNFNPVDGKIGKNTGNFSPINLMKSSITLADIVEQLKFKMNEMVLAAQERQKAYDATINLIDSAETIEQFTELMTDEVVAADRQGALKVRLVAKAKERGIDFDKQTKCFMVVKNEQQA